MNDDEFTKLFKYIQDMRQEMNERLDATASQESVDQIHTVLDGIIDRLDTDETERTAHASQLTRHEHSIDSLDGRVAKLEARAT